MTRIEFHHNAGDKFAAAARLIGTAVASGARVLVSAFIMALAAWGFFSHNVPVLLGCKWGFGGRGGMRL